MTARAPTYLDTPPLAAFAGADGSVLAGTAVNRRPRFGLSRESDRAWASIRGGEAPRAVLRSVCSVTRPRDSRIKYPEQLNMFKAANPYDEIVGTSSNAGGRGRMWGPGADRQSGWTHSQSDG